MPLLLPPVVSQIHVLTSSICTSINQTAATVTDVQRRPLCLLAREIPPQVLLAACEPPSIAALELLGVRGHLTDLPGWGTLFHESDFHVQMLHKSLAEFLRGESLASVGACDGPAATGGGGGGGGGGAGSRAPAALVVDVRSGHRLWAAHCARLALGQRDLSAPPDAYALRYAIRHLAAAHALADGAEGAGTPLATPATPLPELDSALLDFDFWEHVFSQGGALEFQLTEDVAAAAGGGGSLRAVARDVLRWLLSEGRFMRRDPSAVLQRALAAPRTSAVRAAAIAFHRRPELALVNPPANWPPEVLAIPCGFASWVCFSPDGSHLLIATGDVAQARWAPHWVATPAECPLPACTQCWACSGPVSRALKLTHSPADRPAHCRAACSPLFSSPLRRQIRLAAMGQLLATLKGHAQGVSCCAWSRDGLLLATSGWVLRPPAHPHSSSLPALKSQPPQPLILPPSSSPPLPPARPQITVQDQVVRVWDASTGHLACTTKAQGSALLRCAFSPDGAALAVGGANGFAAVFDTATGELSRRLAGHAAEKGVRGVAYSPDTGTGKGRIATACEDKIVRLFDSGTGALLASLTGHADSVRGCDFAQDGRSVVSVGGNLSTGGSDVALRIWDVTPAGGNKCRLVAKGHTQVVESVAFSLDASSAVSASEYNGASFPELKVPRAEIGIAASLFSERQLRVMHSTKCACIAAQSLSIAFSH